jgi:drug/metabolite transporter (DMT)-like permease
MIAIALGMGAALSWGLADFLGGIGARRLTLAAVLVVSQLTGLAAVVAVAAAGGAATPPLADVAPAVAAGVCQIVGIAALYQALAIGTMSVISPVSASGAAALPVIVGVAGGERPGALQVAGMAAALVGVLLATRATAPADSEPASRQALGLAALAALGFGGFFVGMDAAVEQAGVIWALLVARAIAVAVLGAAVLAARPPFECEPRDLAPLALIGLLDVGANVCFALGADTGLLSVVAVLASLYPVATVVLARAVLGERLAGIQAAGVAVALAGVALIATG